MVQIATATKRVRYHTPWNLVGFLLGIVIRDDYDYKILMLIKLAKAINE
jgi:hypothetical protein